MLLRLALELINIALFFIMIAGAAGAAMAFADGFGEYSYGEEMLETALGATIAYYSYRLRAIISRRLSS